MSAQTELDDVFFSIYKEMCQNICRSSAESAKTVLEHSSHYLSSQANKALNDIYNLYSEKAPFDTGLFVSGSVSFIPVVAHTDFHQ